jgi:peroxiredoxin
MHGCWFAVGAITLCAMRPPVWVCTAFAWLSIATPAMADVVLSGDTEVLLAQQSTGGDLWTSPDELTRISGFHLKPQGLCLEDMCVPIAPSGDTRMISHGADEIRVNAAELARRLGQGFAHDEERRVWSFGPVPVTQRPFLEQAQAPDFTLRDRTGREVRLQDFRGKKVVLVVWASWCACRDDLPVWEKLYRELHDQGLEILAIAEDAEGVAAAGPFIEAAGVTFPALIDSTHSVTAAYRLVNVPTAVWIDEGGTIVRVDQGAYPEPRTIIGVSVGKAGYVDALRDWVANGASSPHVRTPQQLAASLGARTLDAEIADQEFRLGAYFHARGDAERATLHWERAAALAPDNWNYRRQEWSDSKFEATVKFLGRAFGRGLRGIPYYGEIDLPEGEAAASEP